MDKFIMLTFKRINFNFALLSFKTRKNSLPKLKEKFCVEVLAKLCCSLDYSRLVVVNWWR